MLVHVILKQNASGQAEAGDYQKQEDSDERIWIDAQQDEGASSDQCAPQQVSLLGAKNPLESSELVHEGDLNACQTRVDQTEIHQRNVELLQERLVYPDHEESKRPD